MKVISNRVNIFMRRKKMRDYLGIDKVTALEVLDSRGNPTVQVEVVTDGGFSGIAMVPSRSFYW